MCQASKNFMNFDQELTNLAVFNTLLCITVAFFTKIVFVSIIMFIPKAQQFP